MHFLKTKVDKTEWAVALFYEQFANSTDGIAFSMTLMHTEQDWKKLDIEKNPVKHIYKKQEKFGKKINAQIKHTLFAKFIIHLLGAKIQPVW